MSDATLPSRVREFYTLEEAEREARAFPDTARSEMTRALALAFQKREAAEALWPRGCSAEALTLARGAVDRAAAALEALGSAEDAPKPAWLFRARAIVNDAERRLTGVKLPELEAEARPTDEETFAILTGAMLDLERVMGLGLAPPAEIRHARVGRIAVTAGVVVLAIALLVWWARSPLTLHASASSQIGSYPAENAVDGNPKTVWVIGEKSGWLDVTLSGTHMVKSLRVAPSNPPLNDRNIKDARIEAFLGDKIVKGVDITFREPVLPEADWTEIPLGVKCDRIRINARNSYKLSPGISEVEVR